jgi:hypothetical protein
MAGETILVVEDEPAIRRLMTLALEIEGYRVVEARNGTEALERFTADVDLLLVDIRLPYLSGDQVIAKLRLRRQSLRVLAISAYAGAAPPHVPFLAKPFLRDQLLEAVHAALGSSD